MASLAESFLEDLEELDEESEEEIVEKELDEADMEVEEKMKQVVKRDIATVAGLRQSEKYQAHINAIRTFNSSTNDSDREYSLLVSSNDFMVEMDDELIAIHRLVVDLYSKKFPELESLIPNAMDYIRAVEIIGNETDMTQVDLTTLLPSATVMGVSVTGSTTSGVPLTELELRTVLDACSEALMLESDKNSLLEFVSSRMAQMAPNTSALLGTRLAAQLIGRAGGLSALSRTPACNIQVMGQQKQVLSGFSNASALKHTGLIYFSELVQSAPQYLRAKASRAVAGKVTLAARVDCQLNSRNVDASTDLGNRLREELEIKIEKWQEPQKGRTKKALPIPDEKPKRKRGGKRYRKMKERMQLTDVRQEANRQSFATADNEYGDNAMGISYGRLGQEGSGQLRVVRKEQKQMAKKLKAASYASHNTSGLASSLAFTPVQGLELMNPEAAQERVRQANKKYFGDSSTAQ